MNQSSIHAHLSIIDLLSEGHDWFTLIKEEPMFEIAKRIKATPTACLLHIMDGAICEAADTQPHVLDFAQKEFATRLANNNCNPNGDARYRYTESIAGYDKYDKNLHEVLSADDPVEKWIADFVKSDNPKFDGKTKKERINMALGAFYASKKKEESVQDRREQRIVELATKSTDENLVKFFLESNPDAATKTVLDIHDLYEDFVFDLAEAAITIGSVGKVKCIARWGACTIGKEYEGIWKPASRPNQLRLDLDASLPRATSHPIIFFDKNTSKLDIQKQFELL